MRSAVGVRCGLSASTSLASEIIDLRHEVGGGDVLRRCFCHYDNVRVLPLAADISYHLREKACIPGKSTKWDDVAIVQTRLLAQAACVDYRGRWSTG